MPSVSQPYHAPKLDCGIEIYTRHTATPVDVITDILSSAEVAYATVAARLGESPSQMPHSNSCLDVVDEMGRHLLDGLKKGYAAKSSYVIFNFLDHLYLSIYPPNSERRILADPTWQQFLPEEQQTPEKPKVLIGTPEEIGKQLLMYGFTREQIVPWAGKE